MQFLKNQILRIGFLKTRDLTVPIEIISNRGNSFL